MPWVQLVTDNFNRVNQDLNVIPWASLAWGTCKILNNVATGSASPNLCMSSYVALPFANDQYVEGDLVDLGGASYNGVTLRTPGGTSRGYMAVWQGNTAQLHIIRFSFPATVLLNTWPHPTGAPGRIRFEAVGTTLLLYWNAVFVGNVIDAFYADGVPGLANSTQSNLTSCDNWAAGEWQGGTGGKSRRHRGGELWGIIPEIANYLD